MTRNDSDRRAMKQLKVATCQQGWGRTLCKKSACSTNCLDVLPLYNYS